MSDEPQLPGPIPEGLTRTLPAMYGDGGRVWLDSLPGLVAAGARRWGLRLDAPYPQVNFNYVAPGTDAAGRPVVFKIGHPDNELATEMEALRLYDGRGAVRLLDADEELGALLLERAVPGTLLESVRDDERAAGIAAGVMKRLWRPLLSPHPFPSVDDWVGGMARKAPILEAQDPTMRNWVQRALAIYAEVAADREDTILLHGDLHQGNILAAEREPWLAVDPKGVAGPPVWETGPLLINVLPEQVDSPEGKRILLRRADQLAEELGIDRARLRAWGVVRAVLAAFWTWDGERRLDTWCLRIAAVLSGP